MLKMLLTSVDLMYARTSVSYHLDPSLFCDINWPVIANKLIIHFTFFVPSTSTKDSLYLDHVISAENNNSWSLVGQLWGHVANAAKGVTKNIVGDKMYDLLYWRVEMKLYLIKGD